MSSEKFTYGDPDRGAAGVAGCAPGRAPEGFEQLSPVEQVEWLVADVIATLPPMFPDSRCWVVRNVVYKADGYAIGHCDPVGPPGFQGPAGPYTYRRVLQLVSVQHEIRRRYTLTEQAYKKILAGNFCWPEVSCDIMVHGPRVSSFVHPENDWATEMEVTLNAVLCDGPLSEQDFANFAVALEGLLASPEVFSQEQGKVDE